MTNKILKSKYQKSNKKSAFTLMELLIAASIFAGVMVIATGVLAQSSTFRGKIKATRETSEQAKQVADMITRDIRSANTEGTINEYSSFGPPPTLLASHKFKNGIALLKCNSTSGSTGAKCMIIDDTTPTNDPIIDTTNPYNSANSAANAIAIFNKNWVRIYFSDVNPALGVVGGANNGVQGYNLYYEELPAGTPIGIFNLPLISLVLPFIGGDGNVMNKLSSNVDLRILFNGFAPGVSSGGGFGSTPALAQSYINFYILSQSATSTTSYVNLPVNSRARTEIQSSVTARSFGN